MSYLNFQESAYIYLRGYKTSKIIHPVSIAAVLQYMTLKNATFPVNFK